MRIHLMMQAQAVTMKTSKRHVCRHDSGFRPVTLSHYVCYGNFQAIPRSPACTMYNIIFSFAVTSTPATVCTLTVPVPRLVNGGGDTNRLCHGTATLPQ